MLQTAGDHCGALEVFERHRTAIEAHRPSYALRIANELEPHSTDCEHHR